MNAPVEMRVGIPGLGAMGGGKLSMRYSGLPFPECFAAAAKDGFKAVEYLFPYA